MAITSARNKPRIPFQLKSAQFRFAVIYVLVTFLVLLFLNIYSAQRSQELFYNSKKAAMLERCRLISGEISSLDILNHTTVSAAITDLTKSSVTRILVTDQEGRIVYDSTADDDLADQFALFPQIVSALRGSDVFTWKYRDGSMQSQAAIPVYSYGALIGCVYLMEFDYEQGALIASLHNNILTITLVLEVALVIFSLWYSITYSRRFRKIMGSIRTLRSGDYSHKVNMTGNDELTMLGDAFDDLTARLNISEGKRRQFVSDASHELKTPLASIKLLTDSILQNDMDLQTIREFVGDIGNEADRLNRMSQKLLYLTKIEGQSDMEIEIVYIVPTVKRVVRMLSVIAAEQHVAIHTQLDTDLPILIIEDDLYQIIYNLVENGIKYNKVHGNLFIRLYRNQDNAILSIQDEGTGIPKESLEHIFERFYRVDRARSRSTGGSGLGLSIVSGIVQRYHGSITVESAVGKGTTFTVTFPIFDTEEEY